MPSNRHHVVPKSRGGGRRDNLVVLPVGFHDALHAVFGNLNPDEYMDFLEAVMVPGTSWTNAELDRMRKLVMRDR